MPRLTLDPSHPKPPTRTHKHHAPSLPQAKSTKSHPSSSSSGPENASLFFIGTATTLLHWSGITLLTDPNFLHAGDHVHLGPGVTATRLTNPAIDLHELPAIDAVLLSHYHEDHFDRDVEADLRRDLPIITTPHAKEALVDKKGEGERFERVFALDFFESMMLDVAGAPESHAGGGKTPAVKVIGMPGKHVPPGPIGAANDLLGAVPPTNGWMLELGYQNSEGEAEGATEGSFECGYRIYISGDTLMVDELKEIPERYKGKGIDLMLVHLGGTTIPGPKAPLLMVTMDAEQGVQLIKLIQPDVTIPIHYDDYSVFLSPLEDFKKAVEAAGLNEKVVYLDRKDEYKFMVK